MKSGARRIVRLIVCFAGHLLSHLFAFSRTFSITYSRHIRQILSVYQFPANNLFDFC